MINEPVKLEIQKEEFTNPELKSREFGSQLPPRKPSLANEPEISEILDLKRDTTNKINLKSENQKNKNIEYHEKHDQTEKIVHFENDKIAPTENAKNSLNYSKKSVSISSKSKTFLSTKTQAESKRKKRLEKKRKDRFRLCFSFWLNKFVLPLYSIFLQQRVREAKEMKGKVAWCLEFIEGLLSVKGVEEYVTVESMELFEREFNPALIGLRRRFAEVENLRGSSNSGKVLYVKNFDDKIE